MAALEAGRAGLDVILANEDVTLGGRLLSDEGEIDSVPAMQWLETVKAELNAMENVRIFNRTTVTGAYDNGTYGALERWNHLADGPKGLVRECFWRIVAKRTILASGAWSVSSRLQIMTARHHDGGSPAKLYQSLRSGTGPFLCNLWQ